MSKFDKLEIEPKEDLDFIEEEVTEEPIEEVVECVIGFVNTSLLNVRVAPNADADVVTVIKENTKVEIGISESTDDFYKVYLENGVDGFCMKHFVTVPVTVQE